MKNGPKSSFVIEGKLVFDEFEYCIDPLDILDYDKEKGNRDDVNKIILNLQKVRVESLNRQEDSPPSRLLNPVSHPITRKRRITINQGGSKCIRLIEYRIPFDYTIDNYQENITHTAIKEPREFRFFCFDNDHNSNKAIYSTFGNLLV